MSEKVTIGKIEQLTHEWVQPETPPIPSTAELASTVIASLRLQLEEKERELTETNTERQRLSDGWGRALVDIEKYVTDIIHLRRDLDVLTEDLAWEMNARMDAEYREGEYRRTASKYGIQRDEALQALKNRPTVWAYEAACAATEKHTKAERAAEERARAAKISEDEYRRINNVNVVRIATLLEELDASRSTNTKGE